MKRQTQFFLLVIAFLSLALLTVYHKIGQAEAKAISPMEDPVTSPSLVKADFIPGPLTGEVLNIIDGDTIDVRIQVWLGQTIQTRVRISGIDTPELRGKCDAEKQLAEQARQEVVTLLKHKTVQLYNIKYGKFAGRILADAVTPAGQKIDVHLIDAGLARPYHGAKRQTWCKA